MTGLTIRDLMHSGLADNKAGIRSTVSHLGSRNESVAIKRYSVELLCNAVLLGDLLLLYTLVMFSFYLYSPDVIPVSPAYIVALSALPAAAVIGLRTQNAYSVSELQSSAALTKMAIGWSLICLSLAAFLPFPTDDTFTVWSGFVSWYASGLVALLGMRAIVALQVKAWVKAGHLNRRTAIVGGGPPAEGLIRALEADPTNGLQILGIFDDRDDTRSPTVVRNYPKLGKVRDLTPFARQQKVDLILITLPLTAEDRILQMLRDLWVLPVDIRLSAHAAKLRLQKRSYSYIGSVPVLDLIDRPISDLGLVAKWLFDKIVGFMLLVVLAPLFAAVAVAVKLDSPGSVLFKQQRYGFNNELIEVFKFRSLYTDQSDASSRKQVTRDDPRVTRVGRFIRKTSLDELPQLFNVVFKGNLSLVGPRPHALQSKAGDSLFDEVVESYFARHKVKPGVTGWAQINGWRGETDTEEKLQRRVACDLHYIENWSLFLDLYILLMTPLSLLRSEHAY